MECFLKSFKENYPSLCKERRIVVIDCTKFSDPDHDKSLRSHKGTHYRTFQQIVNSKEFEEVNKPLSCLSTRKKNLVINVCKSGRHRSVANTEAQLEIIKTRLHGNRKGSVKGINLQNPTHWTKLCASDCSKCDVTADSHQKTAAKAKKLLKHLVPKQRAGRNSLPADNKALSLTEKADGKKKEKVEEWRKDKIKSYEYRMMGACEGCTDI